MLLEGMCLGLRVCVCVCVKAGAACQEMDLGSSR